MPLPPPTSQLLQLEQRLDGRLGHLAGRLAMRWRERRASRAGAVNDWRPVPPSGADPERLAGSLAISLKVGALESAERLCATLVDRLAQLTEPQRSRAVCLVVDALLMSGERERALSIASSNQMVMAANAQGATLLDILELGTSPALLPNGRPNFVGLSRGLGRRSLGVTDLVDLTASRPWLWLQAPELHLLFFNALLPDDAAHACSFLNRYLALHGLPGCRVATANGSQPFLAQLAFATAGGLPTQGPLVSVLVASRNARSTLTYALDSLLAQSYRDLEILVGDDASDDDSWALLTTRYGAEPRVRLFRSRQRQGAYNVRNALAQRARGEFLAFHDADDLALPQRVAKQVAALSRGQVGCVSDWLRVRPDGSVVFFKDQRARRLSLVSLLVARRAFDAVGPFRSARVGADYELQSRLVSHFGKSSLARIRAPLVLGLWSADSATRAAGTEALEDGFRSVARRAYCELVYAQRSGAPPSDEAVEQVLRQTDNYLSVSDMDAAD